MNKTVFLVIALTIFNTIGHAKYSEISSYEVHFGNYQSKNELALFNQLGESALNLDKIKPFIYSFNILGAGAYDHIRNDTEVGRWNKNQSSFWDAELSFNYFHPISINPSGNDVS